MSKLTGTTGIGQQVRTAVVLAVGVIAAIQSYNHIENLALAHMPPGAANVLDARLLPFSVDGLIIAASLALSRTPALARCMLALGVTATVAANVAYGLPHGLLAAVVSAWPGVSFVGSAELLMRGHKTAPDRIAEPGQAWAPVPPVVPTPIPVQASIPDPVVSAIPPAVPAVPGSRTLADEFEAEIAQRRIPGVKQIQKRMGGNQDTAYKLQDQLRQLAGVSA
jgi:Protein of unknown function (DUF2637)